MSNKYSRHTSVVSRQSDESIGEDHWLKQFQKSLQKGAVQPKSVDSSLFDQINSVMNGKSKYPSVAAAVQDMQQRSGLTAYLDKISKTTENGSKKIASDNQLAAEKKIETPVVFKKCPQIKVTLENLIKGNKGNSVVPALIDKLKTIHQRDVSDAKDWEDDNLIREVSRQNLIAKRDNPGSYENYSNLGSRDMDADSAIDPSNTDAFNSLVPVRQ
jgi:hypothetical protein